MKPNVNFPSRGKSSLPLRRMYTIYCSVVRFFKSLGFENNVRRFRDPDARGKTHRVAREKGSSRNCLLRDNVVGNLVALAAAACASGGCFVPATRSYIVAFKKAPATMRRTKVEKQTGGLHTVFSPRRITKRIRHEI